MTFEGVFDQRLKRSKDTNHEERRFQGEINKREHMACSRQQNSQVASVERVRQRVAGNEVKELAYGQGT